MSHKGWAGLLQDNSSLLPDGVSCVQGGHSLSVVDGHSKVIFVKTQPSKAKPGWLTR